MLDQTKPGGGGGVTWLGYSPHPRPVLDGGGGSRVTLLGYPISPHPQTGPGQDVPVPLPDRNLHRTWTGHTLPPSSPWIESQTKVKILPSLLLHTWSAKITWVYKSRKKKENTTLWTHSPVCRDKRSLKRQGRLFCSTHLVLNKTTCF